ncbi:NAD(P)/FAD-dependent oxidoreductase [Rudaeicoccus suwonensis]|uniref:3-phenylpropionate/trans-cinnamate dioxygenase ferredoxin reductase subunit n=1 Tax=Rudaeicoccus suwonensis TaxID=657409 RepID=A0A561E2Z8_9MICO|nr:FAD-dependent oxidoreductase [Rudaeicoccus suwonensis]TWE09984.1 3-phenylpropionate/trans-cinnamate dioxygenase ferredoxin reductase subunit [Rudaeicoccus suwonensis]
MTRCVIIGGGVAAASTIAGLRDRGFDGDITLVGDEPHVPYERPPLSKEFLTGAWGLADIQINSPGWYADHGVVLALGVRAETVDVSNHCVVLSDDRVIDYDTVVLATGSRARVLPGFAGERVHAIRTVADTTRLVDRLERGRHLAILGGGFVGCEVAAVAVERGLQVTLFEPGDRVLQRIGATEIELAIGRVHAERGVDIRTGVHVTSMLETTAGVELTTTDGMVLCDDLLVGVGSIPNTEIAVQAGLNVSDGVTTDEFGRTSADDVFAIGDVASRFHPTHGRHIRVEHHDTAMRHGQYLARTLTGEPTAFTEEHYFWSHQYDHQIQSVGGHYSGPGTRVLRGSLHSLSLSVITMHENRIRSIVALDRPRDILQIRKLIGTPHNVTEAQLADEGFDLKSLAPPRQRPTTTRNRERVRA